MGLDKYVDDLKEWGKFVGEISYLLTAGCQAAFLNGMRADILFNAIEHCICTRKFL
jgi:hypothetical protein